MQSSIMGTPDADCDYGVLEDLIQWLGRPGRRLDSGTLLERGGSDRDLPRGTSS